MNYVNDRIYLRGGWRILRIVLLFEVHAEVAKLVYAPDSKSGESNLMTVRLRPSAYFLFPCKINVTINQSSSKRFCNSLILEYQLLIFVNGSWSYKNEFDDEWTDFDSLYDFQEYEPADR